MEPTPIESVHYIQQIVEVAVVDIVNIDAIGDHDTLS